MSEILTASETCWSGLQLEAIAFAMRNRAVLELDGKKWAVSGIVGREVTFTEIVQIRMEEPSGWNGEGLPPVGTICKLAGPSHGFMPINPEWAGASVKIYAHFTTDNGTKLAAYVDEKHLKGGVGIDKLFLPILTPEQIAAEEREDAILQMRKYGAIGHTMAHYQMCMNLYDAGYRKQEQPK